MSLSGTTISPEIIEGCYDKAICYSWNMSPFIINYNPDFKSFLTTLTEV